MKGIDLNKAIVYKHSSLQLSEKGEFRINRTNWTDILLLVFEGVMRFTEEGKEHKIFPGQYYIIQNQNVCEPYQDTGNSSKYLCVNFVANWAENDTTLPYQGDFDYFTFKPLADEFDRLSHSRGTLTEQIAVFFEILSKLYRSKNKITVANQIADFISKNQLKDLTLEMISKEFNFSKNHIINIFKKEYKMTPFEYMNHLKIKQVEQLLEVTSYPVEDICYQCGFGNYSHFYKLFCRANQISPTEWRIQKQAEKIIGGQTRENSWVVFTSYTDENPIVTGPLQTVKKGDVLRVEIDMALNHEKEMELEDSLLVGYVQPYLRNYDILYYSDTAGEKKTYYADMYKKLEKHTDAVYGYSYRTLTSTMDTSDFIEEYMDALNNKLGVIIVMSNSQITQQTGGTITRQFYRVALINETTGETLHEITGQQILDHMSMDCFATPIKATSPFSSDQTLPVQKDGSVRVR